MTKLTATIYWDDQDKNNEGWAYRTYLAEGVYKGRQMAGGAIDSDTDPEDFSRSALITGLRASLTTAENDNLQDEDITIEGK